MTPVANGFVLQYGTPYLNSDPPTHLHPDARSMSLCTQFFYKTKKKLFCVCVVSVDVCTPHVCLLLLEVRGSDPLDLELGTVMSCCVGARN